MTNIILCKKICRYIESECQCPMKIIPGETKHQYGMRLLKTLATEIREQYVKGKFL